MQANIYFLLYRDREPERQEFAKKLFERLHGTMNGSEIA